MASIYCDKKSGNWLIQFRFGSKKQHHRSLDTKDQAEAENKLASVKETLDLLKRGILPMPSPENFWPFVYSGGRRESKAMLPDTLTLEVLFAKFEEGSPAGAREKSSLRTFRTHKGHLLRVLGARTNCHGLGTSDMQRYINTRCREEWHEKLISPETVKKELSTFGTVWRWGTRHLDLPTNDLMSDLDYPKSEGKHPFMTWSEIERRIGRGGLSEEEIAKYWDSLFLDTSQIEELLDFVKEHARHPFIYPMFVFIAHTGIRRSEMVRCQVDDIDFETGQITVYEKKRDRTKTRTFRHVPMSPLLVKTMREWFEKHPGGQYAFCQQDTVAGSKTRSKTTGHQCGNGRATTRAGRMATVRERTSFPAGKPLTVDVATHHFEQTLSGGKWEVVRGFHVFRHSIASNFARAGVDQREIDEILGHQTEEMRKQYRHFFPEQREKAIKTLFGAS